MDSHQVDSLLQLTLSAVHEAGALIRSRYRSEYEIWHKGSQDPLTTADLEANHHLHQRLAYAVPGAGWLSEETADRPERLDLCCTWVVDPLDGTQEFIRGVDQFAISVAFVEDELPVLGVVHNPATGETFAGPAGRRVTYNGQPCPPLSPAAGLGSADVLVSDTEVIEGMWSRYQDSLSVRQLGSAALKLAHVATGLADAYISLKPKREWDLCAGVALVMTAGGKVTDLGGEEIRFNQPDVMVNGLVAANPALHAELLGLLHSLPTDG